MPCDQLSRSRYGPRAWYCVAVVWLVTVRAINHEDVAFHAVVRRAL